MLRLRPYKPCDADTILGWIKDEDAFWKWSTDRYPHYPITAADMNHKYMDCNGLCTDAMTFFCVLGNPIIVEHHISVKCVSDHDQHLPFVDGRNRL